MSYETVRQAYLSGFSSGWSTFDPAWDQDTRIDWNEDGDGEDFDIPAEPWLRVIFGDVDGFNDAVGVLDTQVALFSVDIYVPLATESADRLGELAQEVRTVIRQIATPGPARPGNLAFRRLGRSDRGEAHGRVGLELQYTLPDVA